MTIIQHYFKKWHNVNNISKSYEFVIDTSCKLHKINKYNVHLMNYGYVVCNAWLTINILYLWQKIINISITHPASSKQRHYQISTSRNKVVLLGWNRFKHEASAHICWIYLCVFVFCTTRELTISSEGSLTWRGVSILRHLP